MAYKRTKVINEQAVTNYADPPLVKDQGEDMIFIIDGNWFTTFANILLTTWHIHNNMDDAYSSHVWKVTHEYPNPSEVSVLLKWQKGKSDWRF